MTDDSADSQVVTYDGRLLSTRVPAMIGVVVFLTFLLAVAIDHTALLWASILAGFVLVVIHWFAPARMPWHPMMQFTLSDDGFEMTHATGRSEFALWPMFEQVRLRPLHDVMGESDEQGQRWWKLTLLNTYKPAISAFLHTRTANRTTFLFPVEIAFRAVPSDAQQLQRTLTSMIEPEAEATSAPRSPQPQQASDHAALLRIMSCIMCDHSLRGLPARRACPECGWRFDEHMFTADIRVAGRPSISLASALFIGIIGLGMFVPVMLNVIALPTAVLLMAAVPLLAIVLPGVMAQFSQPNRLLITAEDIQLWRQGRRLDTLDWMSFGDMRLQRDEGRWRLGCWRSPRTLARLSTWTNQWVTEPHGDLLLDLTLCEPSEVSRIKSEEILTRWRAATQPISTIEPDYRPKPPMV